MSGSLTCFRDTAYLPYPVGTTNSVGKGGLLLNCTHLETQEESAGRVGHVWECNSTQHFPNQLLSHM